MTTSAQRAVNSTERAHEQLREEIISARLMPNERLLEVDLSARLGISRANTRAVLMRLEHEGLVVREPNRGARVRMVTEAEAIEILQVRAVLEALAARHASIRASNEDVAAMRHNLAQMQDCLLKGDLLAYSEGNARLHARIIAASGHDTAERMIGRLKAQFVRFQYRTILVPGRSDSSMAEHTDIVDAIERHDQDAAEAAMRRHLSHVETTLGKTSAARAQHSPGIR